MLRDSLRGLLELSPRGLSDSQLLWRLNSAGLRFSSTEIINDLKSLIECGDITKSQTNLWILKSYTLKASVASENNRVENSAQNILSERLVPLRLRLVKTGTSFNFESSSENTQSAISLPPIKNVLSYLSATQRRDPRGRITQFEDTHSQAWQFTELSGNWWDQGQLQSNIAEVPENLQEALAKRHYSGTAAVGWPIALYHTDLGKVYVPALMLPCEWQIKDQKLIVEISPYPPTINPNWLKILVKKTNWNENSINDALFPEGENSDFVNVAERLKIVLASIGGKYLKPAQTNTSIKTEFDIVQNAAGIFFPTDSTFTQGAAKDLDALSNWSDEQLNKTALGSVFSSKHNDDLSTNVILSSVELTDNQVAATEAALSGPITLIQGPPGTGKSQVILSIINTAILTNKTVLFASKNHQALDEVEHRVRELTNNSEIFTRAKDWDGTQNISFLDSFKELAKSIPTGEAIQQFGTLIAQADKQRLTRLMSRKMDELNIQLSKLCEERAEVNSFLDPRTGKIKNSSFKNLSRIFRKIINLFGLKQIPTSQLLRNKLSLKELDDKILELTKVINKAEKNQRDVQISAFVDSRDVKEATKITSNETTKPSRETLSQIEKRIKEIEFGSTKSVKNLTLEDSRVLLDHRPIWAISNLSAHNRIPLFPAIFDYVVFDEASQSDIASALPLFARAKSAIIVGDPQQLRFIPELSKATEHALMDAADLPREGRYIFAQSVNSLFDFCAHLPTSKRFFLKDQFRSSPDLVHYLSDEFYPGKGLEGRKEDDKFKLPKSYKPGLTWTNVIGQTTRQDGGNINVPEAEQAIVELQKILKDETFKGSVGIISPFNAQVNLIQKLARKKLSEAEWSRLTLRVSTVDKFQGGEADLIIFSLVAAIGSERNALAFLNREKRRINVAVSRARALCIIIGDVEFAKRSGVNHLVRLAHRATQKNERVRPPFDSMWERRMDAAMTTRGIETFPQYSVGTRYLDFAVDPDGKKINVEVDGRIWHTDIDGNRKISDRMRDIELTARGWTVLRFWVHELEQDMESCLDRIEFALKQ